MSWIAKLNFKMDVVEEAFDQFNEDAAFADINGDNPSTGANYHEMNETAKILNLLMATLLPFVICTAYVVCLKIVVMLLEIR
jgi:hypothetical protein